MKMIATLLANIGLPMLVKAVGGALGKINNPAAKIASDALKNVETAVKQKEITPEQIIEANRHTEKMKELETKESVEALKQINDTMRAEIQAEDKFVRRWRPTFGYSVALSWLFMMGSVAYAVIATPKDAPAIISTLVNCSALWGVALGVLGISVVKRSQDKNVTKN
jgi:hydrogenase maturation factor